jgi:hypothetical protein
MEAANDDRVNEEAFKSKKPASGWADSLLAGGFG